ncbi:unnamed protein product [Urochloa humidicola]
MSASASAPSGVDVRIQVAQPSAATTTADVIHESSASPSTLRGGVASTPPPRHLKSPPLPPPVPAPPAASAVDKTLSSVANLAKLLPTGTALAFHSLSPSFTHRGACLPANRYLTAALLYLCFLSCVFFSFTDSFVGADGKLYYGLATANGFLRLQLHRRRRGGGRTRHREEKAGYSGTSFKRSGCGAWTSCTRACRRWCS